MIEQKITDFFNIENTQLYIIVSHYGSYGETGTSNVAITADLVAGQAYVDEMNATYQSLVKKFETYPTALGQWEKEMRELPLSKKEGSITQKKEEFKQQWVETNLTKKEKELLDKIDNYLDNNHWMIEPIQWLKSNS